MASSTALTAALVLAGCSETRPSADAPGTTALPSGGTVGDGADAQGAPNDPANPDASPSGPSNGGSAAPGAKGGGVELPAETETETDYRLPDGNGGTQQASDRSPLVNPPLPTTATARGKLVSGYPTAALPVARSSRIDTTSVSSGDSRVQVALVATTDRTAASVLRFYRLHLNGLGFREKPTSAAGGSEAASFVRGPDVATVTVTPTRTGASYSLFGTLHAGR